VIVSDGFAINYGSCNTWDTLELIIEERNEFGEFEDFILLKCFSQIIYLNYHSFITHRWECNQSL